MAGLGSRFANVGYKDPKPLIPIIDVPMIRVVIRNLTPAVPHQFIFICRSEHVSKYNLSEQLNEWAPGCKIVSINSVTDGAARTCLFAKDFLADGDSLVIANSDQFIDYDFNSFAVDSLKSESDGVIMTMFASDPKWSFVKINELGQVSEVVEKVVVSDQATVGIYFFKSAKDFVDAAERMIAADDKTNGEYYVAPTYNYMIQDKKIITTVSIGSESTGMYGLGTPEDLVTFLKLPISSKAVLGI